ncbi:MAG: cobalt-precorrin 5A hydrolase [Methanobacteriaceae archaeon]|nr:cobalt-precorrin 5A hydrolase [Methanobacteriaceae archaeon]
MKFGIITVTENGKNIASNMVSILENDPTVLGVDVFHKNVKETLNAHFNEYNCWVGIMATGIMVRTICPLIKSKFKDPAVLVMDENGKHVISLLSGHMGGANAFAVKIAGIVGAVPVITTATDLQGKIGLDTLANYMWLEIEQKHLVKMFNQYLAEGDKIDLYLPSRFKFLENHPRISLSYNTHLWDESFLRATLDDYFLDMYPKKMVAGIGSRKGVDEDQLFFALRSALQHIHIPLERLDALATGEMKKDEESIKAVAVKTDLPLEIVPLKAIKEFEHSDCTPSELVQREFGVVGVSEPTALIQAGVGAELILKKTAFNGVTVALAVGGSRKL